MNLTKNERKVVCYLIKNARITDAAISRGIDITLQAVRNIRKKLESQGVIEGYSVKLNYKKLSVVSFSMSLFKITSEGWCELKREGINKLIINDNTIKIWRIPRADITHIVLYAFCTSEDMDNFFFKLQQEKSKYIQIKGIYSFSNRSYSDPGDHLLINKILSESPFTKTIL